MDDVDKIFAMFGFMWIWYSYKEEILRKPCLTCTRLSKRIVSRVCNHSYGCCVHPQKELNDGDFSFTVNFSGTIQKVRTLCSGGHGLFNAEIHYTHARKKTSLDEEEGTKWRLSKVDEKLWLRFKFSKNWLCVAFAKPDKRLFLASNISWRTYNVFWRKRSFKLGK